MTHYNLGVALSTLPGRLDDAVAEYRDGAATEARLRGGAQQPRATPASAMPGRLGDAISEYRETLRLTPGNAEAHHNLGLALSKAPGGLDEAVAQYREAIRLKPGYVEAHDDLGAALSAMPGAWTTRSPNTGRRCAWTPGLRPVGATSGRPGSTREHPGGRRRLPGVPAAQAGLGRRPLRPWDRPFTDSGAAGRCDRAVPGGAPPRPRPSGGREGAGRGAGPGRGPLRGVPHGSQDSQ